ncbi:MULTISPECIES: hypothetical protein [Oscillatoriales]|uniref:Protein kinase domain-containing protein n=1 Tax=Aerosakkonema funiforme FACHB-1375 TaxID=2949571 RepID=A0A926VIH2_9CYAN|nr:MULTISPECIES: hypothetical protein [Oscillatoriales]MBD2184335.1 hypothetical protein [Aerosakkonema funiforme FACHB-1375]
MAGKQGQLFPGDRCVIEKVLGRGGFGIAYLTSSGYQLARCHPNPQRCVKNIYLVPNVPKPAAMTPPML